MPADTKSRSRDMPFSEKCRIFSKDLLKCCRYIIKSAGNPNLPANMPYSRMITSSRVLEDFLDFHGAKNNSRWFFYRELTATIRHISIAAYFQVHINNRLIFYDLRDLGDFETEKRNTIDFINEIFFKIAPVFIDEAVRLNIPMPEDEFHPTDFPTITTHNLFDYNIDDKSGKLQQKNIVKIASDFLNIAGIFDEKTFYEPYDFEQLIAIVPGSINEVEMRHFEMLVHNLQSAFDTYVIHGGVRFGNRKLKRLRSHFSIVLHLLQIVGRLLHLYERRLHDAGYKNIYKRVRDRLAELIDPEALLDRTINYGLYYICHFLGTGKELAREILNVNIERSRIKVGIPQKLGFHSRPSMLVAKIVKHYGGQVELCIGEDRFDAGSVLDVQWAGGKMYKEGMEDVVFEGDTRALNDIKLLASVNYGENVMGKGIPLPRELEYLRK